MPTQPPLPSKILAISTKMYFSHSQSISYAKSLASTFSPSSTSVTISPKSPTIIYIPSFPSLIPVSQIFTSDLHSTSPLLFGAQNCSQYEPGAYTGEVSAKELREIGCSIVELGHAERRREFGETEEVVAEKVKRVIENDMIPLLCIGESSQISTTQAISSVSSQLTNILQHATSKGEKLILAYEPIWAIGAKDSADGKWVRTVVKGIKDLIKETGREEDVKVVYGGAAGPGTYSELEGSVDGLFLGRFAHDVDNVRKVWDEMEGSE